MTKQLINITNNIDPNLKIKEEVFLSIEKDNQMGLLIGIDGIKSKKDILTENDPLINQRRLSFNIYIDLENDKDRILLNEIQRVLFENLEENKFYEDLETIESNDKFLFSANFEKDDRENNQRTVLLGCSCVGGLMEHNIIITNSLKDFNTISIQLNIQDLEDTVILQEDGIKQFLSILLED